MIILAAAFGACLVMFVLWDAFETILLPRRSVSLFRISRVFLWNVWWVWSFVGRRIANRNARENFLSMYALLALIGLLAVWASGMIAGFALLHWASGSRLTGTGASAGVMTDLYMSGTTFFTLGLGDVTPTSDMARLVTVVESGTGLGFLALVLAYLPVLYGAFSRRELRITMLDAWAGSPPAATVILRRAFESRDPAGVLNGLLREWESTSADILESHLSYPILAFFRSQHDNQSWLASLTAILDTCALVIVSVDGVDPFQARLTFAIGRHALVDVSQNIIRRHTPRPFEPDSPQELADVRAWLAAANVRVEESDAAALRLTELRALYVPYVQSLSELLVMPLPAWLPPARTRYNWETTRWARTARDETR